MAREEQVPVLLVENDPGVEERVRAVVAQAGIAVAGVVHSARAGVATARRHESGTTVVLLGTRVLGGPEHAVHELRSRSTPVIVLLRADDPDALLADLVLAGVAGVVEEDRLETLPAALRAAVTGEIALPRRLLSRLLTEYRRRDDLRAGPGAALSPRERETLDLLGRGMSTREVARHLVVEPVTVRTHVASAVRKLRVHSREEAVRLVSGERDHGPGRPEPA